MQLAPDAVDVLDTLRGVAVADDLGIECAQALRLVFRERVLLEERVHLGEERRVRLAILFRIREVGTQPSMPLATPQSQNV